MEEEGILRNLYCFSFPDATFLSTSVLFVGRPSTWKINHDHGYTLVIQNPPNSFWGGVWTHKRPSHEVLVGAKTYWQGIWKTRGYDNVLNGFNCSKNIFRALPTCRSPFLSWMWQIHPTQLFENVGFSQGLKKRWMRVDKTGDEPRYEQDETYIIEYHDIRFLLTQFIFFINIPTWKKITTLAEKKINKETTPAIPCHERSWSSSNFILGWKVCFPIMEDGYWAVEMWQAIITNMKVVEKTPPGKWLHGEASLATPMYMYWFDIRHLTFHFQSLVLLYHGPLLFETFWEWRASHLKITTVYRFPWGPESKKFSSRLVDSFRCTWVVKVAVSDWRMTSVPLVKARFVLSEGNM